MFMHPSEIPIGEFDYHLPEENVAKFPLEQRDQSRLLVYRDGQIEESTFSYITHFLPGAATLVFNESKVIPARLIFHNTKGQRIEIFCLEPSSADDPASMLGAKSAVNWNCLVGNLKRWKEESLVLANASAELTANIIQKKEGFVEIGFNWTPFEKTFADILRAFGQMPIPPYLNRESDDTDKTRYQTVYSGKEGSVAAPTAGLHFSDKVLKELEEKNFGTLKIGLHVGLGTFRPVTVSTMREHEMHSEWMDVPQDVMHDLKKKCANIIAVGTTSLRTIESLYWMGVKAKKDPNSKLADLQVTQWEVYNENDENLSGELAIEHLLKWMNARGLKRLICQTSIMIAPPYRLRMAQGLITNFHQPKSTLLLLVAAVIGNRWRQVYEYALEKRFRFLSYGDSSLLLKQNQGNFS
jgi:S-adenosylmethionine:tRNA ribosyltransferase-isomerase